MKFRDKFRRRPDTQPDRSANSVLVSRGPKAVQAAPGEERETFIREVAAVLNRKTEDIDLSLDLQTDYGCDELGVIECIQIAEDVRNVTIIPSPYSEDMSVPIGKYKTLASIVEAATRSVA